MSTPFQTVSEVTRAEIVEKKSHFICTLSPAADEEEAQAFIRSMKKQYWDARHNCSAYIIGTGPQIRHSSDDGEPSGTAGKPILSVLAGRNLYNVAAVVTRYFGGVLLGTGGLVRAYSAAVEKCVSEASLLKMASAVQYRIKASYTDAGKLQYLFSQNQTTVLAADYTDQVCFQILIPEENEAAFLKAVTEATQNRSLPEETARGFFTL